AAAQAARRYTHSPPPAGGTVSGEQVQRSLVWSRVARYGSPKIPARYVLLRQAESEARQERGDRRHHAQHRPSLVDEADDHSAHAGRRACLEGGPPAVAPDAEGARGL